MACSGTWYSRTKQNESVCPVAGNSIELKLLRTMPAISEGFRAFPFSLSEKAM
ncbi:MAG: hypothetical protein BWY42_00852 [Candidatus Omnitrophica bacterium ADurb.Bin277]|nr:MAG: hypothetical protein BWY42_00852 [Candidatus Omnitrophica bacterium ADurb.Bin277]